MFSYKGRIGRITYLLYHLCAFVGYFIVSYLYMPVKAEFIADPSVHPEIKYLFELGHILLGCIAVLLLYCSIPISVKRYHDLNLRGWHYCIWSLALPTIIKRVVLISGVAASVDAYFTIPLLIIAMQFIYYFLAFVVLCCIPGTKGENKFGS